MTLMFKSIHTNLKAGNTRKPYRKPPLRRYLRLLRPLHRRENYQTLKTSKCSFNVIGGDVTLFDRLIGFANFDNTAVPAKLDYQWLNSVHYDDDDWRNPTWNLSICR